MHNHLMLCVVLLPICKVEAAREASSTETKTTNDKSTWNNISVRKKMHLNVKGAYIIPHRMLSHTHKVI